MMVGSTGSTLLLVFGLMAGAATQVKAQESKKQEVRFDASVPRERQIKLALSSAPSEVSSKATLYVLSPKGYEKVREGTNGFSCLVGRSFEGTTEASMDPMCYDAEGSRTLLLVKMREEELRAKGKSEAEIKADIANGYKAGRFQAPSKPGFVYMLSSENFIRDPETGKSGPFPGHLMFYCTLYDRERPGIRIGIGRNDALSVVAWGAGRNDDSDPSAIGAGGSRSWRLPQALRAGSDRRAAPQNGRACIGR
jgi:hypothetical protein